MQSGDEVAVGENFRLILRLDADKYVAADAGCHWYRESGRTYLWGVYGKIDKKIMNIL